MNDLTDDEVEVILYEDFYLLAELLLDGGFAFAGQVRRRLTDAACDQSVSLTRHFFRNATRRLIYRLSLHSG